MRRIHNFSVAVGTLGLLVLLSIVGIHVGRDFPTVQAQGFEPFSKTFTVPVSLTTTIIPACTTGSTECIPNYKQIAHQVSDSFAGSSSPTNCGILIDGSNDNLSYYTLAAIPPGNGALHEIFTTQVNGYFPYIRLKLFACDVAQTITYVGFSMPLPFLNQSVTQWDPIGAIGPVAQFPSPYILNSFTCTNNAASPAYLQLYIGNSTPTLGTGFIYEAGIPANQTLAFAGPPINSYASDVHAGVSWTSLYAGAATTLGGGTAVSTNIDCNFQLNPSGPFFPFNAPSP